MPLTPYSGPIIDSHLHLFDPRRPQGIPWPEPGNRLYAAHLPADYWALAGPHNVIGAIAVEASPWRDDNRWLLHTLRSDPRMLGFVGNLDPLHADFALIKAHKGDRWGNLTYRKAARNFGPIMAMAAKTAIAQVDQIVELGELDPEHIITPGIFVQRVVAVTGAAASSIAKAV